MSKHKQDALHVISCAIQGEPGRSVHDAYQIVHQCVDTHDRFEAALVYAKNFIEAVNPIENSGHTKQTVAYALEKISAALEGREVVT